MFNIFKKKMVDSKVYPTMLSNLIKKLQEELEKQGDIPVAVETERGYCSSIFLDTQPSNYDGGYMLPIENTGCAKSHFVSSPLKSCVLRLKSCYPCDFFDTIDGIPLVELDKDYKSVFKEYSCEMQKRELFYSISYLKKEYQQKYLEIVKAFPIPIYIPDEDEMESLSQQLKNKGDWQLKTILHIIQKNCAVIRSFLEWCQEQSLSFTYNKSSLYSYWNNFQKDYSSFWDRKWTSVLKN